MVPFETANTEHGKQSETNPPETETAENVKNNKNDIKDDPETVKHTTAQNASEITGSKTTTQEPQELPHDVTKTNQAAKPDDVLEPVKREGEGVPEPIATASHSRDEETITTPTPIQSESDEVSAKVPSLTNADSHDDDNDLGGDGDKPPSSMALPKLSLRFNQFCDGGVIKWLLLSLTQLPASDPIAYKIIHNNHNQNF